MIFCKYNINTGTTNNSEDVVTTTSPIIPGDDNGVLPVESTKTPDMADFIVLETNHTELRYNDLLAQQVLHFLRYGEFFRSVVPPLK